MATTHMLHLIICIIIICICVNLFRLLDYRNKCFTAKPLKQGNRYHKVPRPISKVYHLAEYILNKII